MQRASGRRESLGREISLSGSHIQNARDCTKVHMPKRPRMTLMEENDREGLWGAAYVPRDVSTIFTVRSRIERSSHTERLAR